jgi:hypothetical protein
MKANLNLGTSYTPLPLLSLTASSSLSAWMQLKTAIHGRLRDLQYDSNHHEERQMMGDAQRALEFLRRQAALRRPEN